MTTTRHALLVLAVALLATTAIPSGVLAADAELETAAEHDNDSELGAGTLDDVSVSGSGDSATVDFNSTNHTAVSNFDSPDDDYFYLDPGEWAAVSIYGNGEEVTNLCANIYDYSGGAEAKIKIVGDSGGSPDTSDVVYESSTISVDTTSKQCEQFAGGPELNDNKYWFLIEGMSGTTRASGTNDGTGTGDNTQINYDAVQSDPLQIQVDTANFDGRYVSDTYDAEDLEEGVVEFDAFNGASANVEWQGYDGSAWQTVSTTNSVSSAGTVTGDLSTGDYSQWRVVVDWSRSGDGVSSMDRDAIRFNAATPTVDNSSASPSGGEVLTTNDEPLSIDITDEDFGTAQGDSLSVDWYIDGTLQDTTTVNSNGTASYTPEDIDGGSHTWHVVVTDSYGDTTTSDTFAYEVPSDIKVFNELKPTELVDNTTLRFRFFADDEETVVSREVSDGTVSLSGLPVDERFVVTVQSENGNWTYRRIVIDSIYEQAEIYLLPESADSSQVIFELDDPTGTFDPSRTTLYVEKPLEKDFDGDGENETQYRTITGDTFGSSGSFPADLATDSRYRLRVENADGTNSRILGAYSVYGPTTEPLTIERIAPSGDNETGTAFSATLGELDGAPHIILRNLNPEGNVDYVQYEILQEDGSVFVQNTTVQSANFADFYNVSSFGQGEQFTVNYLVMKEDGTSKSGTIQLGDVPSIAQRFDIDPQVLSIISWVTILSTMGLLVIVDSTLAPLGGVGVATALTLMGTVAIPMPLLGIGGAIAVFSKFGSVG